MKANEKIMVKSSEKDQMILCLLTVFTNKIHVNLKPTAVVIHLKSHILRICKRILF